LRLRIAVTGGGLNPDLGDTNHAMQHRAAQLDVVDASKRQVANAAMQQPTANHQRIGIDPVSKGEVVPHREQAQADRTDPRSNFLPIATSTKHQQRH